MTAQTARAAETTARLRAAVEAGDLDAFMATLAPGAVVHSPITARFRFEGHEQVRELMRVALSTFEDVRYTTDVGDGEVRVLSFTARIGGQDFHEAALVRLDGEARVREIHVFVRPLPGLTAMMGVLGPRLAARHGRPRARLVAALVAPLVTLTRFGDRLAVRLVAIDRPAKR